MLSVGKLAPGQQQYYLDTVARGAEEYYTGAKEAPGEWVGTASAQLALAGEVDADALGRVLEHVHPSQAYRLTAARSAPVVAGFDATFCAPKSVSLLYALGDPETSNTVRNVHDAAVRASLAVLEREACRVRRGQGGATVVDGDGFVAAGFRHRTSRAGDPHLHTHVVIANIAHSPADDRWTALDARPLYHWLSPVGHLYEAHLRAELTRRLGVDWAPIHNGIADIAGVEKKVLREFSTRRRQIETHLAERGQSGARAAQNATYATRTTKDQIAEAEGLLPAWRARADAVAFNDTTIRGLVGRQRSIEPPVPESPEAARLYAWLAGPEGVTARVSTFGRREVIKAVCNALPHGGLVEEVLGLVEGFLGSEHVLALEPADGAVIRRGDGTAVAAHTDTARWTTPDMLATERRILDAAQARRDTGAGTARAATVESAIAGAGSLSAEQEAMVRRVCTSGDGIEVVEGVAGAGKTFALAAAHDAWRTAGHRVIGCALAARAAAQLEADSGIPSATIDRLLADLTGPHSAGLDDHTVVVVDEAAMVGTRKLDRLLTLANHNGAKVVLVGDPCQLPEIDAGGAFRGLHERLDGPRLLDNRRQSQPWERHALAALRDGDSGDAFDAYLQHDRVHQATSAKLARNLLVDRWHTAHQAGEQALMVAARLDDVDDLNRRARHLLQVNGTLRPDEIVLGGRAYACGDEVLALRNDYRLGLLNGTRGTIDAIDPRGQTLLITTVTGDRRQVPFAYAETGRLTHGYATTIHKAQGATVDRCFVLVDDTLSREHAYTALSRGRHGNDLFILTDDRRAAERHGPELDPDPLDALRAAVGRSASKHLAHDHTDPAESLQHLIARRDHLTARLTDAPPDPANEVRTVRDRLQQQQHALDAARQRRDSWQHELDNLGPVDRLLRTSRRNEIHEQIHRAERDTHKAEARLDTLRQELHDLEPTVTARARWEQDHAQDLRELQQLDRRIDLSQRLERVAERALQRGAERGHGISL